MALTLQKLDTRILGSTHLRILGVQQGSAHEQDERKLARDSDLAYRPLKFSAIDPF
jgi:hypothetical protein